MLLNTEAAVGEAKGKGMKCGAERSDGRRCITKLGHDGKHRWPLKRLDPKAILTPAEVSAMLACAGNLRDRAFLACLYETGVRKSELAALRLRHIEPTNDHFTLWFGKVKVTGEEHEGFIIEAASILRAWLEAHPWREDPEALLFPTASGEPINAVRIWDFIRRTAKRAGITKRVYPHLFRHSRATHLLQLGVPEAQVKALLGWRQGSPMLARYSHLNSRTAKAAYLKALGREPEKVVVPEGVNFDGATMGAVRPMFLPPKAPKPPAGVDGEGRIFDSKLLMKEAVAEALADVIRSGKLEELLRMAGKVTA